MSMPVFDRSPALTAVCRACGNMESVVDSGTGSCQPCWRVVVLAPWANPQKPPPVSGGAGTRTVSFSAPLLENGEQPPPRDPAAHG